MALNYLNLVFTWGWHTFAMKYVLLYRLIPENKNTCHFPQKKEGVGKIADYVILCALYCYTGLVDLVTH